MGKAKQNRRAARRQAPAKGVPADQVRDKRASKLGRGKQAREAAPASPASRARPGARPSAVPAESPHGAATPSTAPVAMCAGASTEPMRMARRVAWWLLLGMVFVVPIATSNLTFLGFEFAFTYDQFEIVKLVLLRALTLIALAGWAWDLLRHGGRLRRTPVDWLILAFVAWVAITTVTSIHWPTALFGKPRRYEGLLTFMNLALIYFLVLQFAENTARVRAVARALFFSSLIVAGYGVLQFLGWDPAKWGTLQFEANRAFSTYGNPEMLGGFLIFSTSVAAGLALAEQRVVWRLGYWAGLCLNGVALIVTFTRGAWIGGVVALTLVGVIAWSHGAGLRRLDWFPVGASGALGIGIVARSLSSESEVMNFGKRLASIFEFSAGSGQTRMEIWRAAFSAIKERPILGWGADTFRLVFPKFKPIEYVRHAGGTSVADNAHNYPLQLATGLGIPGMLMMYGVFVWAGVRSFGTVFGRSGDPSRVVLGAFWAAGLGHLVHLMFGVPVVGGTFLLWAVLGIVLAPTARVVEVRRRKWGTAVAAVIVIVAALGVGYQSLPLAADHAYFTSVTSGDGAARTEALRRAVTLNPVNGTYRTELGQAYYARVRDYYVAGRKAQAAGQDATWYVAACERSFESGETALKEAITFQPDEYDNYVSLGDLYNLGGQVLEARFYESAIEVARHALALEPYGTSARVVLAYALLSTSRTEDGIAELEYCMSIDPRSGHAALLLAQAYERTDRPGDALALLKSVEELLPGQTGVAEAIEELEAGGTSP